MTSPSFERRYNSLADAISLLYSDGYEFSGSISYRGDQVTVYLIDPSEESNAMHVTTIDLENRRD